MIEFLLVLLVVHVTVPLLIDLEAAYHRRWGQHSWMKYLSKLGINNQAL